MNLFGIFKPAYDAIRDPDRDFSERIFLILTFMSEVVVFIALIGDILVGENFMEIATLVVTVVMVPVIALTCLRIDRLDLAVRIIVVGLVLFVLPALFFYGGGLRGGGVIWIIFAYMYVGLVLKGRWRNIMFAMITVLSMFFYLAAYYRLPLIEQYPHSEKQYYADSFLSLTVLRHDLGSGTAVQRRKRAREKGSRKGRGAYPVPEPLFLQHEP